MIELTDDQKELLRLSREYEEMTRLPAWKHFWGFCNEYAERADTAMRACLSTSPEIQAGFMNAWRERTNFLSAMDNQIKTAIANRAAILEEFMVLMGANEQQIEDLIEKENMIHG